MATTSMGTTQHQRRSSTWMWGLIGVVLIGIVAFLISRNTATNQDQSTADQAAAIDTGNGTGAATGTTGAEGATGATGVNGAPGTTTGNTNQ